MAAVTFDGPGREGESFVTTEVAARWLGVHDETFLRMVGHRKGGNALPGVSSWMHAHHHGQKTTWAVEDLIVLRHILRGMAASAPEPPQEGEKK